MGNMLYFALQTYARRKLGQNWIAIDPGGNESWLADLPEVSNYLLPPSEQRFRDSREHIPHSFYQERGIDFSESELSGFIATAVMPQLRSHFPAASSLCINIRRGDYYSDPERREQVGFDVLKYVRQATHEAMPGGGRFSNVAVVSDDPQWCRAKLGFLEALTDDLSFVGPEIGPTKSLAAIAVARSLILTNSTFSYWAGYLNNQMYGGNSSRVWVPNLHTRRSRGGRPWQHLSNWRAIDVVEE